MERDPVGIVRLAADLGPAVSREEAREAVEALGRRSLLERGERGGGLTLQPVVLEHATEEIVATAAAEIRAGEPDLLQQLPLVKATAKDYVRRSQERLIAAPLLARLIGGLGDAAMVERQLVGLLDDWRHQPPAEQGYGPGNAVNLLRLLRGDLNGLDLSGLSIRQAYLAEVDARDARLAGAHLAETVLSEAFDFPTTVALSGDGALLAAGTSTGEVWL